jgi:hypothetical protein
MEVGILSPLNFFHEQACVWEGWNRGRRADQDVHDFKEGEETFVEFCLFDVRAAHIRQCQLEPAFGVGDDMAVQQRARVLQAGAVGGNKVDAALDLENVVHVAEIGCALPHLFEGG